MQQPTLTPPPPHVLQTLQDVMNALFNANSNLASYFSSCSFGRATLSPSDVLVLGPITLPCNGSSQGVDWTTSGCAATDYYGWQLWLEDWADEQGHDLSRYRHHVALLPSRLTSFLSPAVECGFTGIGVIGPAVATSSGYHDPEAYSFAWVSGDYWTNPQAWFHELGHNYYLRHSNLPTVSCRTPSMLGQDCQCSCVFSGFLGWGMLASQEAFASHATFLHLPLPCAASALHTLLRPFSDSPPAPAPCRTTRHSAEQLHGLQLRHGLVLRRALHAPCPQLAAGMGRAVGQPLPVLARTQRNPGGHDRTAVHHVAARGAHCTAGRLGPASAVAGVPDRQPLLRHAVGCAPGRVLDAALLSVRRGQCVPVRRYDVHRFVRHNARGVPGADAGQYVVVGPAVRLHASPAVGQHQHRHRVAVPTKCAVRNQLL